MNLKVEYINKFKKLYRQKNGKELSNTEALEHFEKLIKLVRAVYKPNK